MALVLAMTHWHIGRIFTVQTDHHNLQHLLKQRVTTHAQQHLISKLISYRFVIQYKMGVANRATDALSKAR